MGGKSHDGETESYEVTLSRSQAERLLKEYPGALSVPEAIRQAIQEALCRRAESLTADELTEAIADALEASGVAQADD